MGQIVVILSILYAWVLILIGIAFPLTEALRSTWQMSHVVGIFNAYLDLGATIFLVYFQVYHVYLHKRKLKKNPDQQPANTGPTNGQLDSVTLRHRSVMTRSPSEVTIADRNSQDSGYMSPPDYSLPVESPSTVSLTRRNIVATPRRSDTALEIDEEEEEEILEEYITFHRGMATISDDVTSFYLRLGVLVFAIGNLIYLGIQIEHNQGIFSECAGTAELNYPYYFHLIFVVAQTFFLFKNSTIAVKTHKPLVLVGIMHVLATNMCIWLRVLIFEVMEAIRHGSGGEEEHSFFAEDDTPVSDNSTDCPMTTLLMDSSAYLYPFVLEYSLIGAATMACMYQAVTMDINEHIIKTLRKTLLKRHETEKAAAHVKIEEGGGHHSHHHNSNLDKSHIGMFLGFILLSACVVSITLSFYWDDNGSKDSADLIFHIMDLVLKFVMLVSIVIATKQIQRLGYASDDNNTIDHVLLLLSFAGLFLLELFALIISVAFLVHVEVDALHILNSINVILALVEGAFQALFLIDGMQRRAVTDKQAREKPGRGCITFLVAANVATWLLKTIEEKKLLADDGSQFYGEAPWAIMLNTTLPLLLFFRFHSSICFAHMWHAAYHKTEVPMVAERTESTVQGNGRVSFTGIYEETDLTNSIYNSSL